MKKEQRRLCFSLLITLVSNIHMSICYQCLNFDLQDCKTNTSTCYQQKNCTTFVNSCYLVYELQDKNYRPITGGCFNTLNSFPECNITNCSQETIFKTHTEDVKFCCCHGDNCNGDLKYVNFNNTLLETARPSISPSTKEKLTTNLIYTPVYANARLEDSNSLESWCVPVLSALAALACLLIIIAGCLYCVRLKENYNRQKRQNPVSV